MSQIACEEPGTQERSISHLFKTVQANWNWNPPGSKTRTSNGLCLTLSKKSRHEKSSQMSRDKESYCQIKTKVKYSRYDI